MVGGGVAEMADAITVFALDLGYLRSGFAIVRQPGDQVLRHGVILAEPQNPKTVTDAVRLRRAKSAYDGLRLALYHADLDFGLDALVYEEPQWSVQKWGVSAATAKTVGMALERLFLTLSLVGWAKVDPRTGTCKMRPVYRLDPARWQPLFTGVARLPAGQTKELVRKYVALRTGVELGPKEHDCADAIAIGIVGSKLLQVEGEI